MQRDTQPKRKKLLYLILDDCSSAFTEIFLNPPLITPKCVHILATQPEYFKLPSNYIFGLQPLKLLKDNKEFH